MTKPLDLSKPVQTRDGRKVRILCTDAKQNGFPVLGLLTLEGGICEVPHFWDTDGSTYTSLCGSHDLVNVPMKHAAWIGVFPDGSVYGHLFDSKHALLKMFPHVRPHKIEWEE